MKSIYNKKLGNLPITLIIGGQIMQVLLLTLVVFSNLFSHSQSIPKESTATICEPITTTNTTLKYPSNHFQTFLVEDEFYKQLDKSLYEEYHGATFSMREKILFKDVPETRNFFYTKTDTVSQEMDLSNHTMIHPNRQVYFLASYRQHAQEEFHKYAVIDAETKNLLIGGSTYSPIKSANTP